MREAITKGLAMNLAGGFHHAKPDSGEGFCVYSDVALAVQQLRNEGAIVPGQRIIYADLDAHQGNGVCHQFRHDKDVFIFDAYNESIYPSHDFEAQERIDCRLPLEQGCSGTLYLEKLQSKLPGFLDSVLGKDRSAIGVYNAGTDVFADDPLGRLKLSSSDILNRDLFVVRQFRSRSVPLVILPSGGYTKESFRLIANTAAALINDDQTA
jgi:histone deacetylase 11